MQQVLQHARDLPEEVRGGAGPRGARWTLPPEGCDLEEMERDLARCLITQALERTGGNVSRAARLLGLARGPCGTGSRAWGSSRADRHPFRSLT